MLKMNPLFESQKATHNCWAFAVDGKERYSDDGEPTGTAGKPILSSIKQMVSNRAARILCLSGSLTKIQALCRVIVVVTRYFGGIKLGTGGLARAYSTAATECLHLAHKIEVRAIRSGVAAVLESDQNFSPASFQIVDEVVVDISVPFSMTGDVFRLCKGSLVDQDGADGENARFSIR